MTHATRDFVWVMRIYALIYLVVGAMFFFMPDETFYLINVGPRVLNIAEPIPMSSERFWIVLATSMMMMLFFASLYSSLYPHVRGMVAIHLFSKAISVAGFAYLFTQKKYFAYIIGAIIDGSIFLFVLGFSLRSAASGEYVAQPAHKTPSERLGGEEPNGSGPTPI